MLQHSNLEKNNIRYCLLALKSNEIIQNMTRTGSDCLFCIKCCSPPLGSLDMVNALPYYLIWSLLQCSCCSRYRFVVFCNFNDTTNSLNSLFQFKAFSLFIYSNLCFALLSEWYFSQHSLLWFSQQSCRAVSNGFSLYFSSSPLCCITLLLSLLWWWWSMPLMFIIYSSGAEV